MDLFGRWLIGCVLVAGMGLGCGSTSEVEPARAGADPLGSRLQLLDADLGLGAVGPQVATVHAYLRTYGYLPNAELAARYPTWRPAVATEPANEERFDDRTALAVKAAQSFFGLTATGVVDAPTRDVFKAPRCGQPDTVDGLPADSSEKFSHSGQRFNKSSLTWKITSTDDGIPLTTARTTIANALSSWAASTSLTFTNVASGATDLTFTFNPFCPPFDPTCCGSGACPDSARTTVFFPNGGTEISSATITFYTETPWSAASSTPQDKVDLQSSAVHEIGHALGLSHSNTPTLACMFPWRLPGTQRRALTPDDHVAIGLLYDQWTQIVGAAARDIATGPDGSVWIVSNTPSGANDFTIQRLVGSTFQTVSGIAGVRVGVDNLSRPWVLTSAGTIRLRSASGYWGTRPGCAKDLAVGGSEWWIISCESDGAFDYRVKAWNGTGWTATDGWGLAISAGPDGIPWVAESNGHVWRKHDSNPATTGWQPLPISAQDIAVDPVTGNVWFLDAESGVGNDFTVGVWSEQEEVLDDFGRVAVPGQFNGVLTTGVAARIAALDSDPWIVKSDWGAREVWHRAR